MEENRGGFEDRLLKFEDEYDELQTLLSYDEIIADNKLYTFYLKRIKEIETIALNFKSYKKLSNEILENEGLEKLEIDENIKLQLHQKNKELIAKKQNLYADLKSLLSATTIVEKQKIKIEITSKTENEKLENLTDMFKNFAQINNFEFLVLETKKESLILQIYGIGAYEKLKDFSGQVKIVYRGKSSFATLVVLKENFEKPKFQESDVIIQTYKSSGAGGQHINKTESAVRLLHIPTGITVECQGERSQVKNKTQAFELLKQKIENNYALNYENDIKLQRKNLKNAIFSTSASLVLDFDRNIASLNKNKSSAKLSDILAGKIELFF